SIINRRNDMTIQNKGIEQSNDTDDFISMFRKDHPDVRISDERLTQLIYFARTNMTQAEVAEAVGISRAGVTITMNTCGQFLAYFVTKS
ncbi:hypothetical protein KA005_08880, partial [bacterium]|nr:hypothetical protein [bacterium]